MFCWRQNSEKIFNKILYSSSTGESDDEEPDSDEDDLSTSCFAFEGLSSAASRPGSNTYDEEFEKKLKLWTDLTNIDMGPYAKPAEMCTLQPSAKTPDFRSRSSTNNHKDQPFALPEEKSLTFKFQYLIISEKLKVTVMKGNNLVASSGVNNDVEIFARVRLSPSKTPPKNIDTVRGSTSPEFNSVVYFNGLSLQEVHETSLCIAIYCRNKGTWRYDNIGETAVSLENYDLTSETMLRKCLDTKVLSMPKRKCSFLVKPVRSRKQRESSRQYCSCSSV